MAFNIIKGKTQVQTTETETKDSRQSQQKEDLKKRTTKNQT